MELDAVPRKKLNEIEITVTSLIAMMRKAKLHEEPLAKSLVQFEKELGEVRRKRFEESTPEYRGY